MAGIYVHIPFCKKKCSYCDFYFSTSFEVYRSELVAALCQEIESRGSYLSEKKINTIYFGGGTPSLLTRAEFAQILASIRACYDCENVQEMTLEANPDDITYEEVVKWKELGFNRLSIGIQTFEDKQLQWMNRAHNAQEAINCVQEAQRAGIHNISVDLIYGLPDMSNELWRTQVEKAIELGVSHISAYCLTVEEKTSLHQWVKSKKIQVANNSVQAEQFEILTETLQRAGFEHYEISNFAKPGAISQHNSNYWRGQEYIGIGPSAHSYNVKSRTWNIANNQRYIQKIKAGEDSYETEELSKYDVFNETILIGLRCKWGVDLEKLQKIISFNKEFSEELQHIIDRGLGQVNQGILTLTPAGRLFADGLAEKLFILEL